MITTCDKCGGLRAEPGESYAGRGCECPLPPARGSAAVWDEVLEFVLAEIDNHPDDWNCYEGNWRNGYNQCRNRIARLLENVRRHNE